MNGVHTVLVDKTSVSDKYPVLFLNRKLCHFLPLLLPLSSLKVTHYTTAKPKLDF